MKSNIEVEAKNAPVVPARGTTKTTAVPATRSPAAPKRNLGGHGDFFHLGDDPAAWKGQSPPPQDRRCECCWGAPAQATSFPYAYLLRRNQRPVYEVDERPLEIYDKYFLGCPDNQAEIDSRWSAIQRRYGQDQVEDLRFLLRVKGAWPASWECRECGDLTDGEYFKRRGPRLSAAQRAYLNRTEHPWALTAYEESMVIDGLQMTWGEEHLGRANPYGWMKGWEMIAGFYGLQSLEELRRHLDWLRLIAVKLPNGRLYSNIAWNQATLVYHFLGGSGSGRYSPEDIVV